MVFGQQLGKHNRSIEIDHRSLLSPSNSARRSRSGATGAGRGGSPTSSAGGVNQPLRTASASCMSARIGLLVSRGGPISATTRSRSVTRTVSPDDASRTYSLRRLLSILIPTDLMYYKVATSGYLVNPTMCPRDTAATCSGRSPGAGNGRGIWVFKGFDRGLAPDLPAVTSVSRCDDEVLAPTGKPWNQTLVGTEDYSSRRSSPRSPTSCGAHRCSRCSSARAFSSRSASGACSSQHLYRVYDSRWSSATRQAVRGMFPTIRRS